MKYDTYIGIDPGAITGVAIWVSKDKYFEDIFSCNILRAMDRLGIYTIFGNTIFIIENPNLRKWYGTNSKGKEQGAGSIKRDYSIWCEWFFMNGVEYMAVNPKDINTKMKAKPFKNLTGWNERTNSHARDAAMMVFGK